jgi:hypothetical protein
VDFLKFQNGCTFTNTMVSRTVKFISSKHMFPEQKYFAKP